MTTFFWNANHGVGQRVVATAILFVALTVVLAACGDSNSASESGRTADSMEQAPAFELPDQFDATYSFSPGDGKNHVFVFYMGYF